MTEQLSDEGVVLREWVAADAPAIVECVSGDDEITWWLDRVPQPYTVEDALGYISSEDEEKYAVTDAETGDVLGSIGLTWRDARDVAEVGYWLRADGRGRGVMTRALRLIARHAFENGAERVQLRADVQNEASCRVAERAGFTREGILRSETWNTRQQRRIDHVMYSLLPGELPA